MGCCLSGVCTAYVLKQLAVVVVTMMIIIMSFIYKAHLKAQRPLALSSKNVSE